LLAPIRRLPGSGTVALPTAQPPPGGENAAGSLPSGPDRGLRSTRATAELGHLPGRGSVQGGEEPAELGRGRGGVGQPLRQRKVQQRHAGALGMGPAPVPTVGEDGFRNGQRRDVRDAARSSTSELISLARRIGSGSLLKRTISSPLTS
jgi:hypothetical protein